MGHATTARAWTRRAVLRAAGGAAVALPMLAGTARAAAQPAPGRGLLRMLAATPDVTAELKRGNRLVFGDYAAAKRLYGFEGVRTADDYMGVKDRFAQVLGGQYSFAFPGFDGTASFRDRFGYDFFQTDRELSMGGEASFFARLEGAFDANAVGAKLRDAGYATASHRETDYATGNALAYDGTSAPHLLVAACDDRRIVALTGNERTPVSFVTEYMRAALDAEAGGSPLDANPSLAALALALPDATGLATVLADDLRKARQVAGAKYDERVRGWNPLRPASVVAMGHTDRGDDERTLHVARVYTNADDAAADAPELERRIAGYVSVSFSREQRLIPEAATGVTTRVERRSGAAVLVADLALVRDPRSAVAWTQLLRRGDVLFLVPDPAAPPAA